MHGFTCAIQDWIGLVIFKNLRIRTGLDLIFADQIGLGQKFVSPSQMWPRIRNSSAQREMSGL